MAFILNHFFKTLLVQGGKWTCLTARETTYTNTGIRCHNNIITKKFIF